MLTYRLLPAVAAMAVAGWAGSASSAEILRVGGTGGALGMMTQVAAAFEATSGIKLEILASLGSNGALRAVGDGAIEVALSARKLTPAETKPGLVVVPFARTALVFVTSHPKPNGWKSDELAGIFGSKIRNWNDGTPLNIILRTKVDSDTAIIGEIFPGVRDALEQTRKRPDVPIASTDQDSAELAENLTGSFVQAGLSQIVSERRRLRLVAINGVNPSLANLESGAYPYEKLFYLVFRKGNQNVEALVKFMASEQAREILRETGNLPVSE